jgi:hypothetical protein
VLNRGRKVFKFQEGNIVAFEGDKPVFDPDGSPLTATAWVTDLAKSADFLFKPSGGGGAAGGAKGEGAGAGKTLTNPSSAEFSKNLADIASGKVEVLINQ